MSKYMEFQGSRDRILEEFREKFAEAPADVSKIVDSDVFRFLIYDFIYSLEDNYKILADDEEFERSVPGDYSSEKGFISSDASYFIGIRKVTYTFMMALAKRTFTQKYGSSVFMDIAPGFLNELLPNGNIALFYKFDKLLGESCIVLEAAKNRKKGIDKKYFNEYGEECINNHLDCGCRMGDYCKCGMDRTGKTTESICRKLCAEKILIEKKGKYYYKDLI